MEYYSAIKKNDIMPFVATWMELETLTLSEVSHYMISLISGIEYIAQINLSTEKKLRDLENRLVVAKQEVEGVGRTGESEVTRCKLLHLEWINNEILPYSTGNHI